MEPYGCGGLSLSNLGHDERRFATCLNPFQIYNRINVQAVRSFVYEQEIVVHNHGTTSNAFDGRKLG